MKGGKVYLGQIKRFRTLRCYKNAPVECGGVVCGMAGRSGTRGRLSSRARYFSGHVIGWRRGASAHPLGGDELDFGALYFWPGLVGSCPLHVGGCRFRGTFCCEAKQPAFGGIGWQWRSVGIAISAAVLATT